MDGYMLGGIRNDQLMDQTWHYVDKTYGMYNTGAVPASFHYGRNAEKGGKERQQILELYIQQQVLHAVLIETVERGQFGKHEEPVFEYFNQKTYGCTGVLLAELVEVESQHGQACSCKNA